MNNQQLSAPLSKYQFYLLLLLYTYLSLSRPGAELAQTFNDLLMHFLGYALLINSCLLAFGSGSKKALMFFSLFAYSLGIEIIQHFIPYREFSLLDLLANALGLFTGQVVGLAVIRIMHRAGLLTSANEP